MPTQTLIRTYIFTMINKINSVIWMTMTYISVRSRNVLLTNTMNDLLIEIVLCAVFNRFLSVTYELIHIHAFFALLQKSRQLLDFLVASLVHLIPSPTVFATSVYVNLTTSYGLLELCHNHNHNHNHRLHLHLLHLWPVLIEIHLLAKIVLMEYPATHLVRLT